MSQNFIPPAKVSEAGTGAVRSADLSIERWDLISYSAVDELAEAMREFPVEDFAARPTELVGRSIYYTGRFLAGYGFKELVRGWSNLTVAINKIDMSQKEYEAWAVTIQVRQEQPRTEFPPYELVPYHGLRRIATTCHEGCEKYGMHNWLHGFQVYSLLNHTARHLVKWLNGDNSEDHLGHCSWGFMAPVHMLKHRPDMCKYLLGEGYTLTDEIKSAHPHKKREPMNPKSDQHRITEETLAAELQRRANEHRGNGDVHVIGACTIKPNDFEQFVEARNRENGRDWNDAMKARTELSLGQPFIPGPVS